MITGTFTLAWEMRDMHKFIVSVVFTLVVFMSGCNNDNPETADAGIASATSISVGYLPIADCAQLFVGIEKGFFKDAGLSIEPIPLASGVKILEATATKSIDVGFSAVAPLILARSQGLDLVALTGGPTEDAQHPEHALLVRNNSNIKNAPQLEGKTIGIVALRSIDEIFVREWLAKHGVNVSKVRFLEIPFPQMEPTLLTGEVDAVATIEPFVTMAEINNKTRVLGRHFIEVQPVTEISSYNVRRDWAEENKKAVQRFRNAFEKATHYANLHPEETRSIVTKYVKLDTEVTRRMSLPLFTYRLSVDSLQAVAGLMVKWGIIDNPGPVQDLVYP